MNMGTDKTIFTPLDRHFGGLMERLAGGTQPLLARTAALVSRSQDEGNVCLDLRDPDAQRDLGEVAGVSPVDFDSWLAALRAAPVVGQPGEFKPLILDPRGRLYLYRYWEYETRLAAALRRRAEARVEGVNFDLLRDGLRRFFPKAEAGETDWQQAAVFAAMQRRLCVITGGPGTGKTHTVVVLLALLLEQAGETPLRVALAAPTGKAAARLLESLRRLRPALPCAESVRARLPSDAATLHRLLGATPGSASFRHGADNPLPADVVVVDEASMVDLALMAKLFDALPEQARVILLGDKDQLASVEAGAVLGEICGDARNKFSAAFAADFHSLSPARSGGEGESHWAKAPPLPGPLLHPMEEREQAGGVFMAASGDAGSLADCIVQLERTHRFAPGSGIPELGRAVNSGDAGRALEVFNSHPAVRCAPLPAGNLKETLRRAVLDSFGPVLRAPGPAEALAALGRFRILAALRQGPWGVETLNRLVGEILREAGLAGDGDWFAGRVVMVTENDHAQRLFNGDVGIAWREGEGDSLRVFFPEADGATRSVAPARLPRHETAFALTVHKSQGSEFERVLLVLPSRDNRVLTRELIYTAVTRAAAGVEVWMDEAVFRTAVARRIKRASGLREALWGP